MCGIVRPKLTVEVNIMVGGVSGGASGIGSGTGGEDSEKQIRMVSSRWQGCNAEANVVWCQSMRCHDVVNYTGSASMCET